MLIACLSLVLLAAVVLVYNVTQIATGESGTCVLDANQQVVRAIRLKSIQISSWNSLLDRILFARGLGQRPPNAPRSSPTRD